MVDEIPPGTKCANCEVREATMRWAGDQGMFALTHGTWLPWCEVCAVEAQLDYARDRAASIPELEKKLADLKAEVTT